MFSGLGKKLWGVSTSISRRIPPNSAIHFVNCNAVLSAALLAYAPKRKQRYVVFQGAFLAAVKMDTIEKRAGKILKHKRLRQAVHSILRKPQEAPRSELLPL